LPAVAEQKKHETKNEMEYGKRQIINLKKYKSSNQTVE
jgi:hypothetical protein